MKIKHNLITAALLLTCSIPLALTVPNVANANSGGGGVAQVEKEAVAAGPNDHKVDEAKTSPDNCTNGCD